MDFGVECYETLLKKPNHILQLIPFNSNRKRASTAVEVPESDRVRVFCKGGPEVVFNYVSSMIDSNGT
jgi:magnesium-transporting ATPase (P-type)